MLLDMFNDDAYSLVSLTLALDRLPYAPTKIGNMGLFRFEGITSLMVAVELREGRLSLVPTAARGTMPTWVKRQGRNMRAFTVTNLPINDTVMADDIKGIRAFGTEDSTEAIATVVNNRMQALKNNMSTTFEWHRMGALRGQVLDADLTSVIYDWFDEWDIVQTEVDIDFGASGDNIKLKSLDILEAIAAAMKGDAYTRVHALVGQTFYRNMLANTEIKEAYEDQVDFRRTQQTEGFEFGGITWEPYRGSVGGTPFIADDEAIAFPVGATDLFIHYGAPAPFMETVGTVGRDMYAKQERMKFDTGVELNVTACPLFMCTNPAALIRVTDVTVEAFTAPSQVLYAADGQYLTADQFAAKYGQPVTPEQLQAAQQEQTR